MRALLVAAVLLLAVPSAGAQQPSKAGYPTSIAAIGDSITKAYNTETIPFRDGPAYSWSTGTKGSVQSEYLRILRGNPAARDRRSNVASDGARMFHLNGQVAAVIPKVPDYVTIMLGSNDVCRPTEAKMTSVTTFRQQLWVGLYHLTVALPDARIQVVSIPDAYRLWQLFKGNVLARAVWDVAHVCQSLLARPRSTAKTDVDRRERVRQRTRELNAAMASVCRQYVHCRSDGNAVFNTAFSRGDVNPRDYFHPSRSGQAKLAQIVWGSTFDFADVQAPASLATVLPAPLDSTQVTITAGDDRGVAAIEYRIDTGRFLRYVAPVVLTRGHTLEWRAVDVNGNLEETRALIV